MSRETFGDEFAPLDMAGDWRAVFAHHPFNVELARAEGIWLIDNKGRRYIDASGGPMAVNLGHGDPRMKAAIQRQAEDFCYAHPVLANPRRRDLCKAVASVAPEGMSGVYLVSGGSEAVETALKIARQYHVARGKHDKWKFVSFYGSYHGMTLATVALSGNPGMARGFEPMMPQWPKAHQYSDFNRPEDVSRDDWARKSLDDLEKLLHGEGPETIAAIIATPHGCGADYGLVAPKSYWEGLRQLCDDLDILLIADEVVTGFGRTGRWFAMEHFAVLPDIMTVAKGMSSSQAPLGAAIVSDKVRAPFDTGAHLVHGFTNGGHPLACAAGLATIEILKADKLVEQAAIRGEQLFGHRDRLLRHRCVADVRGWGLFMVLELVQNKSTRSYFDASVGAEQRFQAIALSHGLVLYSTLYGSRRRPLMRRGLPMWISPPFVISASEVDELMDRLDAALTQWEQEMPT